jgi:hypothetical protein
VGGFGLAKFTKVLDTGQQLLDDIHVAGVFFSGCSPLVAASRRMPATVCAGIVGRHPGGQRRVLIADSRPA